jgi:glucose/mannose transport system substrate-binding protein
MSPDFQQQFSLYKGSIPIRQDVSMDQFDGCAKKSFADEQKTIKSGGFLPSLAFGMVQSTVTAGAISDVVSKFMNSNQDAKSGVQALAAAAKVK